MVGRSAARLAELPVAVRADAVQCVRPRTLRVRAARRGVVSGYGVPMNGDVSYPWWVGLLIVCGIILIMACAIGRGGGEP